MNPELPIVPSIQGAMTTVEVHDEVDQAPPMAWARGLFQPTGIHLTYRHFHDERGWQVSGAVTGIRIRKDGSLGADDARAYVGWPRGADPGWVIDFIARHMPPEVFDVRQPDAVTFRAEPAPSAHADDHAGFAASSNVFLPMCKRLPTQIQLTSTGELRFISTDAPNEITFAQLTGTPPVDAGSWPATYTANSARTAAAQLLSYAHTYRAHAEGNRVPPAQVDVRPVEPNSRTYRASRWDLGMAGMNIRFVTPFTAFLDMPTPNYPRTLTDIAAEEWAGALLALARELDRAQIIAEQAIHIDRAGTTDMAELRRWLATITPDLSSDEERELANLFRVMLESLDRARVAERARIAAGRPVPCRIFLSSPPSAESA